MLKNPLKKTSLEVSGWPLKEKAFSMGKGEAEERGNGEGWRRDGRGNQRGKEKGEESG